LGFLNEVCQLKIWISLLEEKISFELLNQWVPL
jgi:hypothetical protein